MCLMGCIAFTIGLLAIASGFRLWFKAVRAEGGPKALAKVAAIVIIILALLVVVFIPVAGIVGCCAHGGMMGPGGMCGGGAGPWGGPMMGRGYMTGPGHMPGMGGPEGMPCPECMKNRPGNGPGITCPLAPSTATKPPATATK